MSRQLQIYLPVEVITKPEMTDLDCIAESAKCKIAALLVLGWLRSQFGGYSVFDPGTVGWFTDKAGRIHEDRCWIAVIEVPTDKPLEDSITDLQRIHRRASVLYSRQRAHQEEFYISIQNERHAFFWESASEESTDGSSAPQIRRSTEPRYRV